MTRGAKPLQKSISLTYERSSSPFKVTHYYITVLGKDPSPPLLARFKASMAAFHVGSQFNAIEGVRFEIEAHFSIEKITFKDMNNALVEFEYDCGSFCEFEGLYHYRRQDGQWQFLKEQPLRWTSLK